VRQRPVRQTINRRRISVLRCRHGSASRERPISQKRLLRPLRSKNTLSCCNKRRPAECRPCFIRGDFSGTG
jgi:hypothetical protein